MRIGRIETDGRVVHAVVEEAVYRPLREGKAGDETVPHSAARLLAPVVPRQVILVGMNYAAHAKEAGMEPPEAPLILCKTPNAITGPGAPIVLPKMAPDEVDYEGEIVVVIGQEAKHVGEAEALEYVLGYTCGNDVSARDCQFRLDKQWARAKCFDTFAPIGPWIETDVNPDNLRVRLRLNGEVMQEARTSEMMFSCSYLVSYLSRCMTLWPGSVIFTGTPPGVGFKREPAVFLREGDTVSVEVEGVGELTNPVTMER